MTVKTYPPVKGMVLNVFFWDHNNPEGSKDENSSKQNSTEAGMAARLAYYLTQQGYASGDITILTPYVGQLLLLRAEVRKYMRFVVSEKDAEQLDALQVKQKPLELLQQKDVGQQWCAACGTLLQCLGCMAHKTVAHSGSAFSLNSSLRHLPACWSTVHYTPSQVLCGPAGLVR